MRKLTMLLLTLVILAVSVTAQVATITEQFVLPGVSTMKNILRSRITFCRLTHFFDGTITTCSFKLEKSDDGVTWTDLTLVLDCTSVGKLEFISPLLGKFIRFNVLTLSGGGTLVTVLEVFRGEKCGREYRGIFSVESSSDPAVGAELSITIPSAERWRVYSSSFELQADATVADREVFLTASKDGKEYFRTFADGVVKSDQRGIFTAASLGFVGTAGLGPSSINQPTDVRTIMIPIYSESFIPGGHTLSTDTNGLQAGDNFGLASVLVERCPN